MSEKYNIQSSDPIKAFDEVVENYKENNTVYFFCDNKWHGGISAGAALLMLISFIENNPDINHKNQEHTDRRLLIHSIFNKEGAFGEYVENNIDLLFSLKINGFWDEVDWVGKWWKPLITRYGIDSLGHIFVYGGRREGAKISEDDYNKMIESFDSLKRKKEFIQSCMRIYSLGVIRGWGGKNNHVNTMELIGKAERKYGRSYIESEVISYIWKTILPSNFLSQNDEYLSFTKWILKHAMKEDKYNIFLWTCCQIDGNTDLDGMWMALADYSWDGHEEITPWVSDYPPTPLIEYLERVGMPNHPIGKNIVKSIMEKSFLQKEIYKDKNEDTDEGEKGGDKNGKKKGRLM